MRKGCFQCFLKHIGDAAAAIEEVHDGYKNKHLVMGHLDHAAQEIRKFSKEFAQVVRAHRLKWTDDHDYMVPFEAFEAYVDCLEDLPDVSDVSEVEIPEDCYEGLDKLASGEGYNLMWGDQR